MRLNMVSCTERFDVAQARTDSEDKRMTLNPTTPSRTVPPSVRLGVQPGTQPSASPNGRTGKERGQTKREALDAIRVLIVEDEWVLAASAEA